MIIGIAQVQTGEVFLHDEVHNSMSTNIDCGVDPNLIRRRPRCGLLLWENNHDFGRLISQSRFCQAGFDRESVLQGGLMLEVK